MSEIQKLKNEIKELKDENEKRLQMITKLENQLHESAYYKEGSYAIEAVKRERIIEEKNKEIQKIIIENQILQDRIENLKKEYVTKVKEKNKEIELKDKEIQKLKDENKKIKSNKGISTIKGHNERGAGRKSKLKEHDKEVIKMYRLQGKTIKEISELYNCSVGLIHKIISEKN